MRNIVSNKCHLPLPSMAGLCTNGGLLFTLSLMTSSYVGGASINPPMGAKYAGNEVSGGADGVSGDADGVSGGADGVSGGADGRTEISEGCDEVSGVGVSETCTKVCEGASEEVG